MCRTHTQKKLSKFHFVLNSKLFLCACSYYVMYLSVPQKLQTHMQYSSQNGKQIITFPVRLWKRQTCTSMHGSANYTVLPAAVLFKHTSTSDANISQIKYTSLKNSCYTISKHNSFLCKCATPLFEQMYKHKRPHSGEEDHKQREIFCKQL